MSHSLVQEREALYFVYQPGCVACEAAEPEIESFLVRNPGFFLLRLNVSGPGIANLGIKIKATPTYVYRLGKQGAVREGGMKAKEIERWIRDARAAIEGGDPEEDDREEDASDEEG